MVAEGIPQSNPKSKRKSGKQKAETGITRSLTPLCTIQTRKRPEQGASKRGAPVSARSPFPLSAFSFTVIPQGIETER